LSKLGDSHFIDDKIDDKNIYFLIVRAFNSNLINTELVTSLANGIAADDL